jgi:hypothetical protein
MMRSDGGDDGQAKPAPFAGTARREERFERATADVVGHARPVVFDDDDACVSVREGADAHAAARATGDRTECVVDEVDDRLFDLARAREDGRTRLARNVDDDVGRPLWLEKADGLRDDAREIDRFDRP